MVRGKIHEYLSKIYIGKGVSEGDSDLPKHFVVKPYLTQTKLELEMFTNKFRRRYCPKCTATTTGLP